MFGLPKTLYPDTGELTELFVWNAVEENVLQVMEGTDVMRQQRAYMQQYKVDQRPIQNDNTIPAYLPISVLQIL